MKLNNFKKHVPNVIYARGEGYYDDDRIKNVEYEHPGKWLAEIEGTDIYQVEIELTGEEITSWFCDCPYDGGDICKHVVAFLLYIKDKQEEHSVIALAQAPEKNQIAELLKYAKKEEIVKFLLQYANGHDDFCKAVESHFHSQKKIKQAIDYTKEVERCFQTRNFSYDRYNFSTENIVVDKLDEYIQKAKSLIKMNCPEEAISILVAVIRNIGDKYLTEFDDYDGDLCAICQDASEILSEVVESGISTDLLNMLMKEVHSLLKNENYDNYGLADLNAILLSINLKVSGVDGGILIIDDILKNTERGNFREPSLVHTKLELLKSANRFENVQSVISEYLYLPEIRKIRLQELIEKESYQEALALINEGITIAEEKRHLGTVSDWEDQKLTIYQQMGVKEVIIEGAEKLFSTGRDSMKYYRILKQTIEPEQWHTYLDELLLKSTKQLSWTSGSLYAQIYIEEKYWDRLMDYVEKEVRLDKSYSTIGSYEKYLMPHYPERMLEFYHSGILNYAKENMGRDHYQYIVTVLKKIATYPKGKKLANEIVTYFKETYPKRKAMMEELAKL